MPRTRLEQLWLGGAALVAVLIAVVGYFFLISPQRARTQDVQAQVAEQQLQGSTLQARIISLTQQQKKLSTYRAKLATARSALPTLDDLSANPDLLRSLQTIAQTTHTSVSSVTIGEPAAVTPPAAASPTSTASSAASSAAPAATTAPAPELYSVAITAAVSGSNTALTGFLTDLQRHQPRALLISAVSIGSATSTRSGGNTMTLTMTAFVRPSASAAAGAATPTTTPTTP